MRLFILSFEGEQIDEGVLRTMLAVMGDQSTVSMEVSTDITASTEVEAIADEDGIDWKFGDSCYLKWDELTLAQQVKLSNYRVTKGMIGEFKHRRGVKYGIGVKFGDDPDMIWLSKKQICHGPDVEL